MIPIADAQTQSKTTTTAMRINKSIFLGSSSLLAAGMAHGAVIINPVNQSTTPSGSGIAIDLNGDGVNDFTVLFDGNSANKPCVVGANSSSGYPGTFPNPTPRVFDELNMNPGYPANPGNNDNNGVPVIPGGTTISSQINVGANILTTGDPGGDEHGKNEGYLYQNGEGTVVGQWSSTGDTVGYVGLAMEDSVLDTVNYGWVELEFNGANSTLTVLETGYQTTPGASLDTPPVVPEPSTVALTGLAGAVLVLAKRKRANLNKKSTHTKNNLLEQ